MPGILDVQVLETMRTSRMSRSKVSGGFEGKSDPGTPLLSKHSSIKRMNIPKGGKDEQSSKNRLTESEKRRRTEKKLLAYYQSLVEPVKPWGPFHKEQ
jgi:hypothetical protein